MARLDNETYPMMQAEDLQQPVVFVVDMINGFAKEGPLADPAISSLAAPISSLLDAVDSVPVFVCDAHDEDAAEFQNFPQHCLRDSQESRVIDELVQYVDPMRVIEKNSLSTAAVDGFYDWIAQLPDDTDFVITGCCTDLCIAQLAIPLQMWINEHNKKMRVIVPADCVDTYDIPDIHPAAPYNKAALDYMKSLGIQIAGTIAKDK